MTMSEPTAAVSTRRALRGVAASPGVASGRAVRIERIELPPPRRIAAPEIEAEIARLRASAAATAASSRQLAERVRAAGHDAESDIFAAHAAMAEDPELVDAASRLISEEKIDGAAAIVRTGRAIADQLAALDDELLRARAADVVDVTENIARHVAGVAAATATLTEPAIVVARDLAPSLTATLPRERLLAIALEGSSPTAHAAILARAYGIPSVVGAAGLLDAIRSTGAGSELIVDGSTGEVIVAPDAADRALFARREAAVRAARTRDEAEAGVAAATRDGHPITLLANIGSPADSETALRLGAAGVGLFRTEFLFLERSAPASEEEQIDAYGAVVAAFAPRPVTIRILDIGGDKPLPYLHLPPEDNPFLGVRALRLAADRPDLFVTQLRACFRAATRGRVKVMAPMVADARDVAIFLDLALRARTELTRDRVAFGEVELGVMLEIPSAILVAETYFRDISFVSLGTNDLLQYTLAVDRGNQSLERYRDALHPALLRLVRDAVDAASAAGIELSVCGEMAGDPVAAVALAGLGVRTLSMTASSLPGVRRAIRAVELGRAKEAATAALADRSAEDARSRFASLVTAEAR